MILYILLCGYPPFNGSSGENIISKVKKGKYSLTGICLILHKVGKGWEHISYEAKLLVKKMLEISPIKRISAESALNDMWIQTMCKKTPAEAGQIKLTLGNLQSFKA